MVAIGRNVAAIGDRLSLLLWESDGEQDVSKFGCSHPFDLSGIGEGE
jgi:hypothetical protein